MIRPSQSAIAPSPSITTTRLHAAVDDNNKKIETQAVKRFTIGYNKLCKNCPTRLQPRVDTLTEMIMGLEDTEREGLLALVAQRTKELEDSSVVTNHNGEIQTQGVKTPEEVYAFQVGSQAQDMEKPLDESIQKSVAISNEHDMKMTPPPPPPQENNNRKVLKEMEETKQKLSKSKLQLAHMNRLVKIVSLFLSEGTDVALPDSLLDKGQEEEEEVDLLRKMGRSELKLELLSYKVKKAKCEKAEAKSRKNRYAASLKLLVVHNR